MMHRVGYGSHGMDQISGRFSGSSLWSEKKILPATILVVEDDELLREMLVDLLSEHGCAVLQAPDAETARQIARMKKTGIDLLLTDVRMPGMSGIDLADELLMRPDMKTLLISGYATDPTGNQLGNNTFFLLKPFSPAEIVAKVRDILGR